MKTIRRYRGLKRLAGVLIALFNLATCPALADTTSSSYGQSSAWDTSYANWTGPYVGGFVGGTWSNFGNNGGPGPSGTDANVMGGADIGYNWQYAQFVLGAEADAAKLDNQSGTDGLKYTEDWMMTYRGRAGYAIGQFLPYATGGLAVTHSVSKIAGIGSNGDLQPGYALGGGVDMMIAPQWFVRAEYLHIDVPSESMTLASRTITGGSGNDTMRVGLNYKF